MKVLPDVVNGWSEIVGPVSECTMRSIFDAKSSIVGVMDTHARFVVLQVVASFRITGRAMKIGAPVKNTMIFRTFKNVGIEKDYTQCQ